MNVVKADANPEAGHPGCIHPNQIVIKNKTQIL